MSEYIVTEFDLHSTEWISEYGQIVRCRDCKLRTTYSENEYERISVCGRIASNYRVRDDDFCSWGERRDA